MYLIVRLLVGLAALDLNGNRVAIDALPPSKVLWVWICDQLKRISTHPRARHSTLPTRIGWKSSTLLAVSSLLLLVSLNSLKS